MRLDVRSPACLLLLPCCCDPTSRQRRRPTGHMHPVHTQGAPTDLTLVKGHLHLIYPHLECLMSRANEVGHLHGAQLASGLILAAYTECLFNSTETAGLLHVWQGARAVHRPHRQCTMPYTGGHDLQH